MIRVTCPSCLQPHEYVELYRGLTVVCKHCKHGITIPRDADSVAPEPPETPSMPIEAAPTYPLSDPPIASPTPSKPAPPPSSPLAAPMASSPQVASAGRSRREWMLWSAIVIVVIGVGLLFAYPMLRKDGTANGDLDPAKITHKELRRLEGHTEPVWSVAFSKDGTQALTAAGGDAEFDDDGCKIKLVVKVAPHELTGGVDVIAASGDDNTLRTWDVKSGRELRRYAGHAGPVWNARFSPDGKQLYSASHDDTLRIWDRQTGRELRRIRVDTSAGEPPGFTIRSSITDPKSGAPLATTFSDPATGKYLRPHGAPLVKGAFAPDGRHALSVTLAGLAQTWELDAKPLAHPAVSRLTQNLVYSVVFTPDGRRYLCSSFDATLRLIDLDKGDLIRMMEGPAKPATCLAFSPDGSRLLSAIGDVEPARTDPRKLAWLPAGSEVLVQLPMFKTAAVDPESCEIWLWDADLGTELRRFRGHTGPVTCVAFSSDGSRALSGSADKTIRLWNVETGAELHRFTAHTGIVTSIAIAPDDRQFLSASTDKTVRLWQLPR